MRCVGCGTVQYLCTSVVPLYLSMPQYSCSHFGKDSRVPCPLRACWCAQRRLFAMRTSSLCVARFRPLENRFAPSGNPCACASSCVPAGGHAHPITELHGCLGVGGVGVGGGVILLQILILAFFPLFARWEPHGVSYSQTSNCSWRVCPVCVSLGFKFWFWILGARCPFECAEKSEITSSQKTDRALNSQRGKVS